MIVTRFLAAVAAFFLVMAVGFGTYGARSMTLEFAVRRMDRTALDTLYVWVNSNFGILAWTEIVQPVLVRPAWLSCATVGIILMGLAITVSYKLDPRHKRKPG